MRRIFTAAPALLWLTASGCATRAISPLHCDAVVEAKTDLQGDYYSPKTGKGPGYQLTFRLDQRDSLPLRRLKLIVVGVSETKKYGEVGDSIAFDLVFPMPIDGTIYPDEVVGYKIVRVPADVPPSLR